MLYLFGQVRATIQRQDRCALVRCATPNMSQHVTTGWQNARNMLRQQCWDMLHRTVAIVWPELDT